MLNKSYTVQESILSRSSYLDLPFPSKLYVKAEHPSYKRGKIHSLIEYAGGILFFFLSILY